MSGAHDITDIVDSKGPAVDIGGKAIEVRPLTVGQLAALVRLVGPDVVKAVTGAEGFSTDDIIALVVRTPETIVGCAAILTDREEEEIENLPLDDAVHLTKAIFEVQKDFFEAKVAPAVKRHFGLDLAAAITDETDSTPKGF